MSTHNFKIWNERFVNLGDFIEVMIPEDPDARTIKRLEVYQENGQKYMGHMRNGMKNDDNAVLYFDSFVYNGPFVDDEMHGEGQIQSADGSQAYMFEGTFRNGRKEGKG